MSFSHRRWTPLALGAALACTLMMSQAAAVYPWGGFPEDRDRLVLLRWSESVMRDGIEIWFEGGDFGWTSSERQILRDSFAEWENVPTSYAAFRIRGSLEAAFTPGVLNRRNIVYVNDPDDPRGTVDIPGGIAGVALVTYSLEDDFLELEGEPVQFPISGGQIFETDIVIDGPSHRSMAGQEPQYDLMGTMVHEIGHLLGLGHSPMANFTSQVEQQEAIFDVEQPVLGWPRPVGGIELIGATPTMYPYPFLVEEEDGVYVDGARDLAPSDIAAISKLYPRSGFSDQVFEIRQEARTWGRPGFPTRPLLGAHIVAYVDHDNDPSTRRIPITSTMTGLHEIQNNRRGQFRLEGLWRELHTPEGNRFTPDYTIMMEPLDGTTPTGDPPEAFDSTHTVIEGAQGWGPAYDTLFEVETFREGENVFARQNRDLGTPVKWDADRRRVVSATSERSLDQILRLSEPMFGDPPDTCPLVVMTEGGDAAFVAPLARGFRDNVLFTSSAGVAMADVYYQSAPYVTTFLRQHPALLAGLQRAANGAGHAAGNVWLMSLLGLSGALMIGFAVVRWTRRRQAGRIAAGVALAACLGLAALWVPAEARVTHLTTPEAAKMSDNIVSGKVSVAESYWNDEGRIVTHVTVDVDDVMKGPVNKGGQVHFIMPGGRVGNIVTQATHLPTFKEGEEVILFLEDSQRGNGHVVVNGEGGKFEIAEDSETGERYVAGHTLDAKLAVAGVNRDAWEEKVKSGAVEDRITVEAFTGYVRDVVAQQAREEASGGE